MAEQQPRRLHLEPRGRGVWFLSRLTRHDGLERRAEGLSAELTHAIEHGVSRDRRVELLGKYGVRSLLLAGFLVPANALAGFWQWRADGSDLWPLWVFLGVFDLILAAHVIRVVRLMLHRFRHGDWMMRWRYAPEPTGSTLEAIFDGGPRFAAGRTINAYLRCVEERFVRSGRSQHLACFERFAGEARAAMTDANGQAGFRFEVPGDLPPSELTNPPTYWEVVVFGKRHGSGDHGVFLAPILSEQSTDRS